MPTQETPLVGYQSKLLNRVDAAEGTMAFQFEKPAGFDFKPGQSADLTLLNPPETDQAAAVYAGNSGELSAGGSQASVAELRHRA
jgi:hypothetical protein